MLFSVIFAAEKNSGAFSNFGRLPWSISKETEYFKEITSTSYKKGCKNVLIMGKHTFFSKKKLEDDNRIEIVLSKENKENKSFHFFQSLDQALSYCDSISDQIGKVFVIGGKDLIEEACFHKNCEEIRLSLIHFDMDSSHSIIFDKVIDYSHLIKNYHQISLKKENTNCKINNCSVNIEYYTFYKNYTDEIKYIHLLDKVLKNGKDRNDRTSTGTISLFGPQIEIDISSSFPLLTTKKLNFKNIVNELLWFLSGSTNTSFLKENGVTIWNGNTSKEFLEKRGLEEYKEGDTGPLYGFQWRHFGADFKKPLIEDNKGIDQIERMLYLLKTEPESRRIFMSAWNPCDLDKICLEPCHVSFQLYVSSEGYIDGKLYMRSNDLFLGAPWNIACYSLLIYMFSHLSGYKPGKLIYSLGDSHIYKNHIEQVKKQLMMPLRPFPKLNIIKKCETFNDFDISSFELIDYYPHPYIKADMAV